MTMSEFTRLGGRLPYELEALVKEFAMPRYMKPMPNVIRQIKYLNRDGGVGSYWCKTCCLILTRALVNGRK